MGRALRYIYVTNDTKQGCLPCRLFCFMSALSHYSMLPLKRHDLALAETWGQRRELKLHCFDNKNVYKGSCFRGEILMTMFWWLSPNDMNAQALEHFPKVCDFLHPDSSVMGQVPGDAAQGAKAAWSVRLKDACSGGWILLIPGLSHVGWIISSSTSLVEEMT